MKPIKQNTMEAIYLQSMTDFITWVDEKRNGNGGHYDIIIRYKNFLKQPLQLGFFVPCDENGNVLDPSDVFKSCEKGFLYGKAKERVLFKDSVFYEKKPHFQTKRILIMLNNKPDFRIYNQFNYSDGRIEKQYFPNNENLTIEDLVNFKLELTDSAIKQIGL